METIMEKDTLPKSSVQIWTELTLEFDHLILAQLVEYWYFLIQLYSCLPYYYNHREYLAFAIVKQWQLQNNWNLIYLKSSKPARKRSIYPFSFKFILSKKSQLNAWCHILHNKVLEVHEILINAPTNIGKAMNIKKNGQK